MHRDLFRKLAFQPLECAYGQTCHPDHYDNESTESKGMTRPGHNDTTLAEVIGVTRRSVQRWRTNGISIQMADVVCIRLGLHPANVWGAAFYEDVAAPPAPISDPSLTHDLQSEVA